MWMLNAIGAIMMAIAWPYVTGGAKVVCFTLLVLNILCAAVGIVRQLTQ